MEQEKKLKEEQELKETELEKLREAVAIKLKKDKEEKEKKEREEREKRRKRKEEKEKKERKEREEKEKEEKEKIEKIKKEKIEKERKEREEKERRRKEKEERKKKEEKERKRKEKEEKEEKEKKEREENEGKKNTKNDKKYMNHLQKIKDFPVKIVPTEAREKDKDNKSQREKAITPNKNNKEEKNLLYDSFMRNKMSNRSNKARSYYIKTGNKHYNSNGGNKTTIECRANRSNSKKKLRHIKTKQNMKYDENYGKNVRLTIETYDPQKFGNNILSKNKSDYVFDKKKTHQNFFKKQRSEIVVGLENDIKNKDTGIEDNDDKNFELNINNNHTYKTKSYTKGRYAKKNKKQNYLYYDPLNPYLANWANSFLKIGYNVGLHSNQNVDGVPILRIQKLKPKIVLPPIYKVKYNQFSETKNYLNTNYDDDASLVCNKVAQKLFSPSTTNYNIQRNKSKNSFMTQTNPKENTETKNDEDEHKSEISIQINNEKNKIENGMVNNEKNKIENGMVIKDDDKNEIKKNNLNVYDVKIEKEKE